jgi:hypothetical protein
MIVRQDWPSPRRWGLDRRGEREDVLGRASRSIIEKLIIRAKQKARIKSVQVSMMDGKKTRSLFNAASSILGLAYMHDCIHLTPSGCVVGVLPA